jgi:hypothetical protein
MSIDAQSIGILLSTQRGFAGAARSEVEEMIPAGGQQAWDECHLVIRNMATLSPFWDSEWRLYRHFVIGLTLAVWQPKLGAPSNQSGKLRPLVATITKPFTGKMSTLRTARYSMGAGLCPTGQKLRR